MLVPADPEIKTTLLAKARSKLLHITAAVRQKDMAMGPVRARTKNICAGWGQQKFTRNWSRSVVGQEPALVVGG
jgi:hypothetical protein